MTALRCWALLSLALLTACSRPGIQDGQVLARVNGDEITVHQFNFALTQAPVRPQSATGRSALLDQLIDRQLSVQQALEKKLDRRPDVMMKLEEARHDILAAAYVAELSAASPGPTDVDAANYYRDHPALFSQRKLYRLREISLASDAPALPEMEKRLDEKQAFQEVLAWLRKQPGSFSDQTMILPAERLPTEVADRLLQVKPGEVAAFRLPRGLVAYQIQSAEAAPMAWTTAAPQIRDYLKKQHDAETQSKVLAELRAKARIERKAGQP